MSNKLISMRKESQVSIMCIQRPTKASNKLVMCGQCGVEQNFFVSCCVDVSLSLRRSTGQRPIP